MQLDLFKNNLPKKPYCSNNLDTGLLIRNANLASQMRYIQHNHVNSKLWLVYDIDRAISPCDIEVAIPNLFIQNPANCHAHLAYSLDVPVHLNKSSSQKPIRFAGAIDCAYREALDADLGYAGLIMKNPLNENWRTYQLRKESYGLNELAEYVDLLPSPHFSSQYKNKNLANYGLGRNCALFEDLRGWAYKNKSQHNNSTAFDEAVMTQALDVYNELFTVPLPFSEIKSVATSVSKWTWLYYNGVGTSRGRGRDILAGRQLDLHDKQVLSAIITGRQQKERTERLIKQAIERYVSVGKKITKVAIAKDVGITRQAIDKSYKHLFLGLK